MHYPSLVESKTSVGFELHCLALMELVRQGDLVNALQYAQEELGRYYDHLGPRDGGTSHHNATSPRPTMSRTLSSSSSEAGEGAVPMQVDAPPEGGGGRRRRRRRRRSLSPDSRPRSRSASLTSQPGGETTGKSSSSMFHYSARLKEVMATLVYTGE